MLSGRLAPCRECTASRAHRGAQTVHNRALGCAPFAPCRHPPKPSCGGAGQGWGGLRRPNGSRPLSRPQIIARAQLSSNDFKPGITIEFDGTPYRVIEFMHVKPGKGAAFVRSKLKNCLTGNTIDKTWRAGEPVQPAQIERKVAEFTYSDGRDYVFMDMTTFEEIRVPQDPSWSVYIVEGCQVTLVLWNDAVISVEPPTTVELTVTTAEPGVKGNTVSGGTKPATVETGAVLQVPLFVNVGDHIKVDTRTCTYISRA